MSKQLTATVDEVIEPDHGTGRYKVTGYRWLICAANGLPIAQQARPSSTEDASWRAFRRFWNNAAEIGHTTWVSF